MPTPADINRVFRDHVRFTGDGLPGAPVAAPLPVGSPRSGVHDPSKKDIRDVLVEIVTPSPAIPNASAGNEVARINSILAMLRARGLIET